MTQSVNSSREPVRATCQRSHGKSRRPTTSISTTKTPTSPSGQRERAPSMLAAGPSSPASAITAASGGSSTSTRTVTRSSTTSQPTAMRPLTRVEHAAALQRAQQHDRARDRERQPEDEAGAQAPAPERRERQRRARSRPRSARSRRAARSVAPTSRSCEREVQPDAEHQQHHADLGELAGELEIGDEARRGRADEMPATR